MPRRAEWRKLWGVPAQAIPKTSSAHGSWDWCKTGGASACRIFSLLFLDRGWGVEWIRPRRDFPPVEYCRGTRPSLAAKCRALLNRPMWTAVAAISGAMIGPTPGIVAGRRRVAYDAFVAAIGSLSGRPDRLR
jgi:hypothetical protein